MLLLDIMRLMNRDIHSIAIVRLSALGDIVNSAVVLQFIKDIYPNVKITWIVEEVFSSLLSTHPLVDDVHFINLKKLKKEKDFPRLKETISELRALNNFDVIIDMQGLLKSAIVARLIGKETHGFDKNSARESLASMFYQSTSTLGYEENVVKRNCFVVADALNFEISSEMISNKKPIFPFSTQSDLPKDKKNIAMVIGASWESKKYPKELALDICNALKEHTVLIWGNEQEREVAQWITDNSDYAAIAPKLSLTELISFISNVDLLIGNDTGPTHMAWAQNIPSITLLGPTTTRMIYETPTNIGIKSPSVVNINKIDKNDFSIKDIPVSLVVEKAKELLNNGL